VSLNVIGSRAPHCDVRERHHDRNGNSTPCHDGLRLYYPECLSAESTLMKSLLPFDETHFMDRPSFKFDGQSVAIGAPSPLRQFERAFREQGVPLFVHDAFGGMVHGDLLALVHADISDPRDPERFQQGLRSSARFRELQIQPGNYGGGETHQTIYSKLEALDLANCPEALEVFNDSSIRPFDHSSTRGIFKTLVTKAAQCSVKLNFAFDVGLPSASTPRVRPPSDLSCEPGPQI